MKKIFLMPFIIIMMSLIPLTAHCEEESGYLYSVIDSEITITGYSGTPESLVIPSSIDGMPVTSIRDNAFFNCHSLKNISLPSTLKTMGHHCFYDCSALEEITLPCSITQIGMGCFGRCCSLKKVVLPDSVKILPDSCFRRCTSLTDLLIPQSVTEIEKFCFCGCSSLRYISLSGNLQNIGTGAFYMCESLDNIYLPQSVESIGMEALGYLTDNKLSDLKIISYPDSVAEAYANENGISFSDAPESAAAFDPSTSQNAPVKLPPALVVSGGLLFLLTALIALKRYATSAK